MNERMRMSENEIGEGMREGMKDEKKEWQKSKTKERKKLIETKSSM